MYTWPTHIHTQLHKHHRNKERTLKWCPWFPLRQKWQDSTILLQGSLSCSSQLQDSHSNKTNWTHWGTSRTPLSIPLWDNRLPSSEKEKKWQAAALNCKHSIFWRWSKGRTPDLNKAKKVKSFQNYSVHAARTEKLQVLFRGDTKGIVQRIVSMQGNPFDCIGMLELSALAPSQQSCLWK